MAASATASHSVSVSQLRVRSAARRAAPGRGGAVDDLEGEAGAGGEVDGAIGGLGADLGQDPAAGRLDQEGVELAGAREHEQVVGWPRPRPPGLLAVRGPGPEAGVGGGQAAQGDGVDGDAAAVDPDVLDRGPGEGGQGVTDHRLEEVVGLGVALGGQPLTTDPASM